MKTYLPYVKGPSDKIAKALKKHKIETTFISHKNINNIDRLQEDRQYSIQRKNEDQPAKRGRLTKFNAETITELRLIKPTKR